METRTILESRTTTELHDAREFKRRKVTIEAEEPYRRLLVHPIRVVMRSEAFDTAPARARATFIDIQSAADETLVRSAHESLRFCREVFLVQDAGGRKMWMVKSEEAGKIRHTHAGGWEIHVKPTTSMPKKGGLGHSIRFRQSPLNYSINHRSFLTADEVAVLRDFFPGSVGAHLLITGYLVILFPDSGAMESCYELGIVEEVGGAEVSFGITSYVSTSKETGHGIASTPDETRCTASLGLRLRLHDGLQCVTTVSHPFVRTGSPQSSAARKVSHWLTAAKQALLSLKPRRHDTPAIIENTGRANTPLGKQVWLAASNVQIGTITKCYDECPKTDLLPYPNGFTHDLSLVTGSNIPRLVNPPTTPMITTWAPYEEALQGAPLFLVCQNVRSDQFCAFRGQAITREAQRAIAHGTGYAWDRLSTDPECSLLWRTVADGQSVSGASGAVLCIGNLMDNEARAVLFHNFEGRLDYVHRAQDHTQIKRKDHRPWMTWKGGFLLPSEIRESEIVFHRDTHSRQFPSVNERTRCSVEVEKRNITY